MCITHTKMRSGESFTCRPTGTLLSLRLLLVKLAQTGIESLLVFAPLLLPISHVVIPQPLEEHLLHLRVVRGQVGLDLGRILLGPELPLGGGHLPHIEQPVAVLVPVGEGVLHVDEEVGHLVPLLPEHPGEEHPLLAVGEDGGPALDVVGLVPVEGVGHLGPVDEGLVVVDHVVILVPDVIVAAEDGHGVDVLVGRVGLLREGVPHVGDAAEEGDGLDVGVEPVGPEEEGAALVPDEGGEAVVVQHAVEHHFEEAVLLALPEEEDGAEAGPVGDEAGEPQDEAGDAEGAVDVHVGVDVAGIVVPAVVDLVVGGAVGVGDGPVEGADEGGVDVVGEGPAEGFGERDALAGGEEGPGVAVEAVLGGVALDVGEALVMREEAIPGTQAHQMVQQEGGDLEAVRLVAVEGPVEQQRDAEQAVGHPRQVRRISRVEEDAPADLVENEALGRPDLLQNEPAGRVVLVEGIIQAVSRCRAQRDHGNTGKEDGQEEDGAHQGPSCVRQVVPRKGPYAAASIEGRRRGLRLGGILQVHLLRQSLGHLLPGARLIGRYVDHRRSWVARRHFLNVCWVCARRNGEWLGVSAAE
mmetsp:Transcript_2885/g.6650  ORF Transcript_2885/g.6650 Transcript_2885/m.6650 type:complete len:582 (-) Transcript_2885:27-1772(-)